MTALALLHGASIDGKPVEIVGEPQYTPFIQSSDGRATVMLRYRLPSGEEFDAAPDWLLAVNAEAVVVLRRARDMEQAGKAP